MSGVSPMQRGRDARTLIIIVNYRIGHLVVDTLRSLHDEVNVQGRQLADVVVVDNQSGDDSVPVLRAAIEREGWGAWARVVESPLNGGFAYGNNLAVRASMATADPYEYFWLLNPDTLARPGSLKALVDFLDQHPRAGMAGSSVEDDEHGRRWPFAFRFHNMASEFDQALGIGFISRWLKPWSVVRRMGDEPDQAEWLSGCSLMVRRGVFEQIGLMDEEFFLYYEETDFCRRAGQAGWERWYVPGSRVYHMAGKSTGVTGDGPQLRRMPAYWFESRRRYFVKHHGRAYAMVTDAACVVGFVAAHLRGWLQRKPSNTPPHYLGDFVRHSALINGGLPGNSRLASPPPVSASR